MATQAQIKEIIKCGQDVVYFVNNYVKIRHTTEGLIQFKTFEFQDRCLSDFIEHRHNIVLKSRQLGISTLAAAYATWLAIFHKDKDILVIATKLATAQNFIRKVNVAVQNLPSWLLLPKVDFKTCSVEFDNGSKIIAVPTSEDAGRSEALSLLIVDEAAFIRDFEEIWSGVFPTLSTGGASIIISTPNGVGGQYHKLWVEAEAGLNDFNPIKLPWDCRPERDQEWFDKTCSNMSKRKFSREYLCNFSTSGDTFLQADDMEWIAHTITPPIEKCGFDHNVWLWERPEQDHRYVISADVSRGDAYDYSTFHVIDATTLSVVAEYKGKLPPDRLGELINEYGRMYNDAVACPENNTFGYITCMKLKELKYPKLYYHSARGNSVISSEYSMVDETQVPGFSMQKGSRVQVLAKLEEVLRNKTLKVFSQRLYNELQTFVWNNGKASAMKDHNDDLIMSIAIGAWAVDFAIDDLRKVTEVPLQAVHVNRRDIRDTNISVAHIGPPVNPQMRAVSVAALAPSRVQHISGAPTRGIDFSWLIK